MATTHRPRLGELLQARGICTRDQLREAWEAKVIYGDRLGTNLLALGFVDEHRLANTLGEQLGVHSGYGKVIKPEPPAIALVPKAVAERRSVVPHHVVDKQLFLLMKDPNDAVAIDEVRFATSLKVVPVVVCEARMWELLARHYNVNSSMRPVPLDAPFVPRPPAAETTSPVAHAPELTSEEDFHRLYAGMHTPSVGVFSIDDPTFTVPVETASAHAAQAVPPPVAALEAEASEATHAPHPKITPDDHDHDAADLSGALTSPGRPLAIQARRGDGSDFLAPPRTDQGESSSWRDTIEKTNPMLALPKFVMVNGEPKVVDEAHPAIIELVEVDESSRPRTRAGGDAGEQSGGDAGAGALPDVPREVTLDFHIDIGDVIDETPLSFAQATEKLNGAQDRNAIARFVLRAARSKFARACLFAVYPDRLVGWMGIGDGYETERVRAIAIPRSERSVFAFVVESRAHYLGPLAKWPAHGTWVKATGRRIPRSIAVLPILVKGRTVNVLVVDNGHDRHVDGAEIGALLVLAQQIAKTYEMLLKKA